MSSFIDYFIMMIAFLEEMHCYNKLKRLKDAVGHLFSEDTDKDTLLSRISADPQFVNINPKDVDMFYSHFREQSELKEEQKQQITELNEDHEVEILELNDEHELLVSELKNEHKKQVSELQAEHERLISELDEQTTELDDCKLMVSKLNANHECLIYNLNVEHERKIAELNAEQKFVELNANHKRQIIESDPDRKLQLLNTFHERRIAELNAEHECQITELKANCKRQVAVLESDYDFRVFKMEVEHKRKVAEVVDDHECILDEIQAEHDYNMIKVKEMHNYRQESSKFLVHEESAVNFNPIKSAWESRYLMNVERSNDADGDAIVKIQDLFQGMTKSITMQQIGIVFNYYPLAFPYVLLYRHDVDHRNGFTLVKFDPDHGSLQIVHSFVFEDFYSLIIDQFNPSKFMLQNDDFELFECKLVNEQVQIGKMVDHHWNLNIVCISYFNNQLYDLKLDWTWADPLPNVRILTYNLEREKGTTFDLKLLPNKVSLINEHEENIYFCNWLRDHVFISVRFRFTHNYGVAFAGPKTRSWTVIEFATALPIKQIQFIDGRDMMVCTRDIGEESESRKQIMYKLSMRKPESLRNMAWSKLVNLFKEAKAEDPYKLARQYLPFNSDIQPFIF